ALQLLLELRVLALAQPGPLGLPVGRGLLDRQVDLAVVLDADDLDGDLVVDAKVLLDRADVVPVDLGDVHEPGFSRLELDERAAGGRSRPAGRAAWRRAARCGCAAARTPLAGTRR